MLSKVDEMIIGGGMAFTFLKKIHNIDIGNSLFDAAGYDLVDTILAEAKEKNVKIHLPVDFLCGTGLNNETEAVYYDLKT